MNVYLVMECVSYEGDVVRSVWLSKEKAEAEQARLTEANRRSSATYEVEEVEVSE